VLGRLISLSGGSAAYIALVASIYGRTHSAVWISAAIFASVVASVASAPLAGWIGDRFDRRSRAQQSWVGDPSRRRP
jgi:MFS family permease